MYNYRIEAEYDGGRYDGWQRLGKDASTNTIENKLTEIISRMTGETVDMYAGSRTEKGVHALCQTANFKLEKEVKAFETKCAIEAGATEIDMVINVGAAKDGNWELVYEDIKAVVDAANGTLVKVIIETCLLTDEEKVKACEMSVKAGAHFVKTSTGFSTGGATVEDVRLMRQTVGETVGVKASGGVRTSEDMKAMLEAGANRIGTSGGVALVQGKENTTAY